MTETCLERWMKLPHFTCPKCHRTSWNLSDVGNQYCGACHLFFGQKRDSVRQPVFREVHPRPRPRPRIVEDEAPKRRREEESRRRDVDSPSFNLPPSSTWDTPDPPSSVPDPPSFDPGGGSSGGGGASGDY